VIAATKRAEALEVIRLYGALLDDPPRMAELIRAEGHPGCQHSAAEQHKDNVAVFVAAIERFNRQYEPFTYKEIYDKD
jgi:hypothetical protein